MSSPPRRAKHADASTIRFDHDRHTLPAHRDEQDGLDGPAALPLQPSCAARGGRSRLLRSPLLEPFEPVRRAVSSGHRLRGQAPDPARATRPSSPIARRLRTALDSELATNAAAGRDVILSGEGASDFAREDVAALAAFAHRHFARVVVLALVRPPHAFVRSLTQQQVKMGGATRGVRGTAEARPIPPCVRAVPRDGSVQRTCGWVFTAPPP